MAQQLLAVGYRFHNGLQGTNGMYYQNEKGLQCIKRVDGNGVLTNCYKKFYTCEEWYNFTVDKDVVYHRNAFNSFDFIKVFDKRANPIYYKDSLGNDGTYEYDIHNNLVHYKTSGSFEDEGWNAYNESNQIIYHKSSSGYEYWESFNDDGLITYHKDTDGLELWYDYDNNHNCIGIYDTFLEYQDALM